MLTWDDRIQLHECPIEIIDQNEDRIKSRRLKVEKTRVYKFDEKTAENIRYKQTAIIFTIQQTMG